MAESNGMVRTTFEARSELEKQMQEVRKVLRDHFRLEEDLFETLPREHARASVRYRAKFQIGCAPSFNG